MKYLVTPAFEADWARLSAAEQALFRSIIRERFHPACERYRLDPATPWPRGLRVKAIQGATGVWEMTWNFSGPDGRATFEWVQLGGALTVRWRRIGGHAVFDRP